MPPWLLTALSALAMSVARVTASFINLSRALTSTAAGLGRGAAGAATGSAAWASRELASNNFLQRRISWAGYHAATAGLEALQVGAVRMYQTGGDTNAGGRAVARNILSQLNDKVGLNLGKVGQVEAAGQDVQRLTERIAEVGGVVPTELREQYFKFRFEAQERIFKERKAVTELVERQYGAGSTTFDEAQFQEIKKIGDDILSALTVGLWPR